MTGKASDHIGVQVYCRRPSLGETRALVDLGVDYIAWDVNPEDGRGLTEAYAIARECDARGVSSTLLVHSRKSRVLASIARMIRPKYLLLSSDREDDSMPSLAAELSHDVQLMMSVPVDVKGRPRTVDSLALALQYSKYAGALTVDTCRDPTQLRAFGCTGQLNNWDTGREIVERVSIPVVLAGGLSPLNVAEAIRAVRPSIVDACTSLELADKSKDLQLCSEFVKAARDCSQSLVTNRL